MLASLSRRLNQGRYRWLIRLAVLLTVGLAFLLWATRERSNRLTVENHSGQTLVRLRATIAGETITFRDVPAGAEVAAPFRTKSDDHFVLEGRLADGTMIRGNFGYVTNGLTGERVRFIVLPGGEIQFRPGDRVSP